VVVVSYGWGVVSVLEYSAMNDATFQTIQASCTSRWTFLKRCWRWREAISQLCAAYARLPEGEKAAADRIASLEHSIDVVAGQKALVEEEVARQAAQIRHLNERIERAKRTSAAMLKQEIVDLEEKLRLADYERKDALALLAKEREQHGKTRQGTGVLLKFIHATHHLDVPFAQGSIREAIQKGMNETAR